MFVFVVKARVPERLHEVISDRRSSWAMDRMENWESGLAIGRREGRRVERQLLEEKAYGLKRRKIHDNSWMKKDGAAGDTRWRNDVTEAAKSMELKRRHSPVGCCDCSGGMVNHDEGHSVVD